METVQNESKIKDEIGVYLYLSDMKSKRSSISVSIS